MKHCFIEIQQIYIVFSCKNQTLETVINLTARDRSSKKINTICYTLLYLVLGSRLSYFLREAQRSCTINCYAPPCFVNATAPTNRTPSLVKTGLSRVSYIRCGNLHFKVFHRSIIEPLAALIVYCLKWEGRKTTQQIRPVVIEVIQFDKD